MADADCNGEKDVRDHFALREEKHLEVKARKKEARQKEKEAPRETPQETAGTLARPKRVSEGDPIEHSEIADASEKSVKPRKSSRKC